MLAKTIADLQYTSDTVIGWYVVTRCCDVIVVPWNLLLQLWSLFVFGRHWLPTVVMAMFSCKFLGEELA